MKHYVTLALLVSALSGHAQEVFTTKKEIDCASRDAVFESVLKTHGHTPVWTGIQGQFGFLLTENKKTGEWTMIQYDKTIACIIAEGVKAKPVFTGKNAT